jgi:hypothetical protein
MNRIQRALTALFCAASFMVFGVAHAQVGESSGVPYFESQISADMIFSTVPANTLRVIKMVNCSTVSGAATKVSVTLTVEGPNGILQIFTLPWVDTADLIVRGNSDGHQAYLNNNVFLFVPSGGRITILPLHARGFSFLNSACALTGYDVATPGLKVGGTGD